MSDRFRNNAEGVAGVVGNLNSIASEYETCVNDIDSLVKSIEASSAWVDQSVKTSFINTCKSYLISYNALAGAMKVYTNYIDSASNRAQDIESHYAG